MDARALDRALVEDPKAEQAHDTWLPICHIHSVRGSKQHRAFAVWRHKPLQNLGYTKPSIGSGAFVAPSATLVGDVSIGDNANVWYGAVLKGNPSP